MPATFPLPDVTRRRLPLVTERRQAETRALSPCRVDERQLFEIEQDPGGMARLGLLQSTFQARALE
jgi:hypothetical protein